MIVNKIATYYRYSKSVNFFGVPTPNPWDSSKQDLYRAIVVYPKIRGSRKARTIKEFISVSEENTFGSIPLGIA